MHRDTWLLLSPLLVIMALGGIMMALGTYWMIFETIRAGIQPFMCGTVAVVMPGIIVGLIYKIEK